LRIYTYHINIVFIILILTIFPFSKLFFFLNAKVQPVSSLITLVGLFFIKNKNSSFTYFIIIGFYLLILSIISTYFFRFNDVLISLISMILPLSTFLYLSSKNVENKYLKTTLDVGITFYILIGAFQFFGFNAPLEILSYFYNVNTGTFGLLDYRGISFLAPEPSNSAFVIVFLFFLLYMVRNDLSKKAFFYYSCILISFIFLNKSGTLALFVFIALLIALLNFFILNYNFTRLLKIFFWCLALVFISIYLISYIPKIRLFDVFNQFYIIIQSGELFNTSNWYLFSGPRFIEVYAGFNEGIKSIFGNLLGSTSELFDVKLGEYDLGSYWEQRRINGFFEESKPNSYLSFITFEAGIIPLIVFILFTTHFFKILLRSKNNIFIVFGVISFFMIYFRSTVTMPIAWTILGIIYYRMNNERI